MIKEEKLINGDLVEDQLEISCSFLLLAVRDHVAQRFVVDHSVGVFQEFEKAVLSCWI